MTSPTNGRRAIRFCRSCGARLARDRTDKRCSACEAKAQKAALAPPEVPPDFWLAQQVCEALADRHMGHVSRAYRLHPFHASLYGRSGVSQTVLAGWLGLTQPQVCRIENGSPMRHLDTLAHWARTLRIPPDHLWFELPDRASTAGAATRGSGAVAIPTSGAVDSSVYVSQHEWRSVRRYLNHHRAELARAAVRLYQPDIRLLDTPLLARADWIPERPVALENVTLAWVDGPQPTAVDGSEPEALAQVPLRATGYAYDRYTSAVHYLDAPTLFENRPSYRLLDLSWSQSGQGTLAFGLATYFDKLDVSETLGHEFAAVWLRLQASARGWTDMAGGRKCWGQLPFRRLIGDPFDLQGRAVVPAISTLTLRRDRATGRASFVLHWRDPAKVATAGGLYDVMPAGEFQPASIAPWDQANDFDLWRNIVRELSEELLGTPEHDGSHSSPIDYEQWPLYRALQRARREGRVQVFCLGVGFDALTLAATIPTALVVDDDVFDELFGNIVRANAEGVPITTLDGEASDIGIAFTEANMRRFVEQEPIASPGAACLALAWRHRDALLTRPQHSSTALPTRAARARAQ